MTKYIRTPGASLALVAACMISACTVQEKGKADSTLAADTTLKNDLALANRDTTAQPALKDVPAAAAPAPAPAPGVKHSTPKPVSRPPVRHEPAPPPPAPATTTTASGNTVTTNPRGGNNGGGSVGTIAAGTSLALRSNARVCTNTYQVGQTFTATVANTVSGTNGASIPAGATVNLEVTSLKRSENANDKILMEFAVRSVSFGGHTYPVEAQVANADIQRVRNEPKEKDAQKVVGGAVLGAIAGQIFGHSTKSTVVGAAAGAAAGAGVAAGTANYEGCLTEGGNVSVSLNAPLQVKS
jgi:hypothetical protein